jgi:CRISPR type III-B/RAMP module RAMP protein Cmr1
MIRQTFPIEIITPCFCAGADQSKAEIRASSIRGQLRWWFRVLGGFNSLSRMSVSQQEQLIFGSISGEHGVAGNLTVRVESDGLKSQIRDGQEIGHPNFSPSAFLTFPIQSREKNETKTDYAGRGTILSGRFSIQLLWKGDRELFSSIVSLMAVFSNLGSLGFRGRRALGAIASLSGIPSLSESLLSFCNPRAIVIKCMSSESEKHSIAILGEWLRSCRSHGRSGSNAVERKSPFFSYAQRDHDIGYGLAGTQDAYRPAIGLPIIQRTARGKNNWEWNWNAVKRKAEGRFASPVILRPHKAANGEWHALVIFIDAKQWPEAKQVFLNGKPRSVSLELYNAMKEDRRLANFP